MLWIIEEGERHAMVEREKVTSMSTERHCILAENDIFASNLGSFRDSWQQRGPRE
jgi:hypothetical protein